NAENANAETERAASGPAVLWREPSDIARRNLFFGPGGRKHQPHGPFTFLREDLEGSNPKVDVRDIDGVKWRVKLGTEARPEIVATRLVWAVGYFADEDYYIPLITVDGLPARLHRGEKYLDLDRSFHNARLKREDHKKIGTWRWRDSDFLGTRELNGL